MKKAIVIIGMLVLMVSALGNVYVRLKMKPREGEGDEDVYWEFEEVEPGYAAYLKWSRITFAGIVLGVLSLFAGMML